LVGFGDFSEGNIPPFKAASVADRGAAGGGKADVHLARATAVVSGEGEVADVEFFFAEKDIGPDFGQREVSLEECVVSLAGGSEVHHEGGLLELAAAAVKGTIEGELGRVMEAVVIFDVFGGPGSEGSNDGGGPGRASEVGDDKFAFVGLVMIIRIIR